MSASIIDRIDRDLATLPQIRSGMSAYVAALNEFERAHRTRAAKRALREAVIDIAAATYRAGVGRPVDLLEFNDGRFDCLFDHTLERTVMMHGHTIATAANSRDDAYHRGYPGGRVGMDKGHAMAHAQGGLEGGPNYFPQARALNQGRSLPGKLWRAIETHLASAPGTFAFVRLIYAPGDAGDTPAEVEYGLLNNIYQFRSVIFRNA